MTTLRHPLSIDTSRSGGAVVLAARGYVELSTRLKMSTALNDAVTMGDGPVVVDLCDVEFLDSTGLGLLLSGLRRLTRQGRSMAVVCPTGMVRRVFEISALDSTFDLHHSMASALATLNGGAATA